MTKKIYVAYTGGTIGMQPSSSGYAPACDLATLLHKIIPKSIINNLPQFYLFEYEQLVDSSNILPDNWRQIATDIANHYEEYDGFVILHGTDTMAYSCAMLSFMLNNLQKPVIFTGSQIPLCEPSSDAIINFIGALSAASDERLKEVCLYFNNRLLRGNRSSKQSSDDLDAFVSPNYPQLGHKGINIELDESLLWKPTGAENFQLSCDTEPHVLPLCLFPGISADWLRIALNQPYSAFILKTYGTGNGPDKNIKLLNVLSDTTEQGKIIVNQTQCFKGSVQQNHYASGSAFAKAGLISAYDTTPEALFCKLHHLFSTSLPPEQIKSLLNTNLSGELTL
ncbi:MAG: asparaginase [Candidatus Endonucleobacter sp. (ex Gigantidas childressi)]|nr:asparaginase [Candidatus Endonucleobacter sp. (ex Gigantidas childressi)]